MEKKGKSQEGKKYIPLSRALTKILRHTAAKAGLAIRPDGYVKIEDIVKVPTVAKFKPTMEVLHKVVQYDSKQRMEISADELDIRAVQGHTMKVCTLTHNCRK